MDLFKLLQKSTRIDWMEGTMNVLAQTAYNVGIEKLSQFVREIHVITSTTMMDL